MNLATVHVAEALATSLRLSAEGRRVGDNITVIGDMILEIPSDTVQKVCEPRPVRTVYIANRGGKW